MTEETLKDDHFQRNLIESHLPPGTDFSEADGAVLAEATTAFIKEINQIKPVATEGNQPALWGYRDGIWEADGKQRLREIIAPVLRGKYSRYLLRETADRLRAQEPIDRDELGLDEPLIPCKDGIYDPEKDELREYEPDDLATWKLQAEYEPRVDCHEFENFLDDVLPTKQKEEIRRTLFEYLAYATQPHSRHQRALFLLGPTRTGKSTLLEVIRQFFGEGNDACQALQKLSSNRFSLAELQCKPINVRSDLSSTLIQNTGLIKELIAGDTISAERKHRDPFRFTPRTKFFFSANQAPGRNINDEAFWRRWITIPMEQQIPPHKRDPGMVEKLTIKQELSGILNEVIKGLERLREGGFTYAPSPDENRKLWVGYGRTEEEFIFKYLEREAEEYEDKDELFKHYKQYALSQNASTVTKNKFTRAIKNVMNARVRQKRINGTRDYIYDGVTFLEDKFDEEVIGSRDNGIPL